MAIKSRSGRRRFARVVSVVKPSGRISPRVQEATPQHFGIVAIDCGKAESTWLLADFYGRVLVPPTQVEHSRQGFQEAIAALRQAIADHGLRDVTVAIEQTGAYHRPVRSAYAGAGFETRMVHPLATQQFRIPADPGNKTEPTDMLAIHRAAANGFGLIEPELSDVYAELRLLARHRRDLVARNAALRNQIHAQLDAFMPGLPAAVGDIFDHEPALLIARHLDSALKIRRLGLKGLAQLLTDQGVRFQERSLVKILAWAERAHECIEHAAVHHRIFVSLDDERRARLRTIAALECDLAALFARTAYVLLLSFPGINVVSAAEFAGEMGPIESYPTERAITGRAGLFPSRYQSSKVDYCDGPLVHRANRPLRYAILLIAENLLMCNAYFQGLGERWRAAGIDPRMQHVRAAKRFCRIAYQMVAGRQVFRHPSCQSRHKIIEKLSRFCNDHDMNINRILSVLCAAADWIPAAERAAEAEPFLAGAASAARRGQANAGRDAQSRPSSRRRSGPRLLSEILPELLTRLGVTTLQSSAKGETDLT